MSKETFDNNFWDKALEKVNLDPSQISGILRIQHKSTGRIFLSDIDIPICFNVFKEIPSLKEVMLQEIEGDQLLRAGVRVFDDFEGSLIFNISLVTDDSREVWHYLKEDKKTPGKYSYSRFPLDIVADRVRKTDYRVNFFSSDFSYSQSLR